MVKAGVIKPSSCPYSLPAHLVSKTDGSWRFCIYYQQLNGHTRHNVHTLPRIDKSLDILGRNKWFCTLELQSGFHQVGIHVKDNEKTAFVIHLRLFEWEVMLFVLCNAPSTFEIIMEYLLRELLYQFYLVYIDDVIVFRRTMEECKINLKLD